MSGRAVRRWEGPESRSNDVAVGASDERWDVLTVEEAAALLKVGRNGIYEAVGRNAIPHRRIGRQIRFSRSALVRWLASWSLQDAQRGQ